MPRSKKIEVYEFWIKEPPTIYTSFDKGKTWNHKKLDFYPLHTIPDTDYVVYKYKKWRPNAKKR